LFFQFTNYFIAREDYLKDELGLGRRGFERLFSWGELRRQFVITMMRKRDGFAENES
jgi:hypothetical protein